MDGAQHFPANGVRGEEVPEELSDDAQAVRLVAVDGFVVFDELLLEEVDPHAVQLAQPLADQAVEFVEGALLRGAFDEHGRHLVLEAGGEVDAEKLVRGLLEPARGHNREVDGAAEVD